MENPVNSTQTMVNNEIAKPAKNFRLVYLVIIAIIVILVVAAVIFFRNQPAGNTDRSSQITPSSPTPTISVNPTVTTDATPTLTPSSTSAPKEYKEARIPMYKDLWEDNPSIGGYLVLQIPKEGKDFVVDKEPGADDSLEIDGAKFVISQFFANDTSTRAGINEKVLKRKDGTTLYRSMDEGKFYYAENKFTEKDGCQGEYHPVATTPCYGYIFFSDPVLLEPEYELSFYVYVQLPDGASEDRVAKIFETADEIALSLKYVKN